MLGRWPCETALGARAQFPERLFPLRTVSCPSAGTVSAVSVTTRRVLPVLQANHPTWGGPKDPTRPAAPPHCLDRFTIPESPLRPLPCSLACSSGCSQDTSSWTNSA